jgi:hypothetical protein
MSPPIARPHPFDPAFPDLAREHRAKPVPPEPHRFVANIYAALVEQILDVSQQKWEPDIEHHRQADDFGDGLELLEREVFGPPMTLSGALPRLKRSSSDIADLQAAAAELVAPYIPDHRMRRGWKWLLSSQKL